MTGQSSKKKDTKTKDTKKRAERESTSSSGGEPPVTRPRTQAPSRTAKTTTSSTSAQASYPGQSTFQVAKPPGNTGQTSSQVPVGQANPKAATAAASSSQHRATSSASAQALKPGQSTFQLDRPPEYTGQASSQVPAWRAIPKAPALERSGGPIAGGRSQTAQELYDSGRPLPRIEPMSDQPNQPYQSQRPYQAQPAPGQQLEFAGYEQPTYAQPQINPAPQIQSQAAQQQHPQAGPVQTAPLLGPRPSPKPVFVGEVQNPAWNTLLVGHNASVLTATFPRDVDPNLIYATTSNDFVEKLSNVKWALLLALAKTCSIRRNGHAEEVTCVEAAATPYSSPHRIRNLMTTDSMRHTWVILAMALYIKNAPDVDLNPARCQLITELGHQTPVRSAAADFRHPATRANRGDCEWAASWIQWKLIHGGGAWNGPPTDEYWRAGKFMRGHHANDKWNAGAGARILAVLWNKYEQKRAELQAEYRELQLP